VIVGIRSDIENEFQFPEPTHSEDSLICDKFFTEDYWIRHQIPKKGREIPTGYALNNSRCGLWKPVKLSWVTIRDALRDVPDPRENHNILDHIFRDSAKSYAGHTGSDIDWPAKTIKAGGHGVPGGENMMRFRDGTVRYFTVYEAKIIQTFPRNYIIKGAWGEALRQIGNAVPVLLARKIGIELMRTLTGINNHKHASPSIDLYGSKQEPAYEYAR
jgi:DNA (cytosine-5)-methyltransferase 1